MRLFRLVAILAVGVASGTPAQLAVSQPTEKLLVLPFHLLVGVDSATSVLVADAAREKVSQMAKYKVLVIPKSKICEALQASGFPCDGVMDEQQSRQLARFLTVDAFTTGRLDRSGGKLVAHVRVIDVGGSGFAYSFTADNGNPVTPAALGEAIASRLNAIIRAAEDARECTEELRRGQFQRALNAARKALVKEPDLPAAHLCMATVYEAQRMPPDSVIAAARRATKGDPFNATAWERIASASQIRGDTAAMIDARIKQLEGDARNTVLRLGIAKLLQLRRDYDRAIGLLQEGLKHSPGDQAMHESLKQMCIDAGRYRCALEELLLAAQSDSALWRDTLFLFQTIGAAQAIPDTQRLLDIGRRATRHYPNGATYWKVLGSGFELSGQPDSALGAYRQASRIDPADNATALLVAKTIIEGASYDTVAAKGCRADTACVNRLRTAFASRLDTAKAYLDRAVASPDSTTRNNAAAVMLPAGEKLVRAGVYDRAYEWLDRVLRLVEPRGPADTTGLRQAIRVNASFWFGLSAVPKLPTQFQEMSKKRSCGEAKQFNEHFQRVKSALQLGRSVHPPTVDRYLQNLAAIDRAMGQVRATYKCTNF